jgi:hypothetical protein
MFKKNVRGFLFGFSLLLMAATACKKDSKDDANSFTCVSCTTQPQALAANDGSSKGIYKGIIIGSSGTIAFNVLNSGTTISAVMVIVGITVNLASSITWVSGQPYVAPFTGTLNGAAVTINFSVNASGTGPAILSATIPGHGSAQFRLVKETSNSLLEAFEGTYSTTLPETGTFNLLMSRTLGQFGGASRKTSGTSNGDFDGTVDAAGKMTMNSGSGASVIGTVSKDEISGSFKDSNGVTITITAKRTL